MSDEFACCRSDLSLPVASWIKPVIKRNSRTCAIERG
jgi:hypothetical protein